MAASSGAQIKTRHHISNKILSEIITIWHGELSIQGGIIGAVLVGILVR